MKQKEFIRYWLFSFIVLVLMTACTEKKEPVSSVIPEKIPLKVLSLKDMSSFSNPDKGWKLVKDVFPNSLPRETGEGDGFTTIPGNGVLLKDSEEEQPSDISTGFEHEDLEIELAFLLPKGATASLLFQGKYGLELSDTWRNNGSEINFCGTLKNGDTDIIPSVNACKAPGLWQKLKVFFRCPRFDDQGNKIKDAQFESVYLNDFLIHKNVEISALSDLAATKDEKKAGPLTFKTEDQFFAIKDLRYQAYTLSALSLENLTYTVYDSLFKTFPDFTTIHPVDSGKATSLEVKELDLSYKSYCVIFKGVLNVPITDTYLFHVDLDDAGEIFIDDRLVNKYMLHSEEYGNKFGLAELEAGKHPFELRFIQKGWRTRVNIFYESMNISKKDLVHKTSPETKQTAVSPILVQALEKPEMVRSFVSHMGEAKTHVISVGDPQGVHYTYNLKKASLIKLWKGQFGDATAMWHSRGATQLWHAKNFTLDIADGIPIARLTAENVHWPDPPQEVGFNGYHIDPEQRPVFDYSFDNIQFEDQIKPSSDNLGLTRSIHVHSDNPPDNLWYRLASGNKITRLNDLLYLIDGNYFLRIESENDVAPTLRNDSELIVSIPTKLQSTIQYSLIW